MSQPARYDQENLELPEEELSHEHLDSQVQKAQEQLLSLKRQQETIERQKRELEELSRRQEQLQGGQNGDDREVHAGDGRPRARGL